MTPESLPHGGPAFPLPLGTGNMSEPSESGGMTMRDYFAAKAMQAQLTAFCGLEKGHGWQHDDIAYEAYRMADAMIKAKGE